jgi:hypothetical protein
VPKERCHWMQYSRETVPFSGFSPRILFKIFAVPGLGIVLAEHRQPSLNNPLTRLQTHKVHQTMVATRQTAARKFLASRS